ncbi:MAG: AAA family ATPase [Candidatus Odinarchaeota archaeon]
MKLIAVSGKGGTGKSTFLALLLKSLVKEGNSDIIVIDGDPDSNLPEILGVEGEVHQTIADIAEDLKHTTRERVKKDVSSTAILRGGVNDSIIEENDFDLLVLGAIEKEGCYCFLNSQLSTILDKLVGNYTHVLLDLPAGLEHLSRRTVKNVDHLFIVTDGSKMGITTSKRVSELAEKMRIKVNKKWIVANRIMEGTEDTVKELVDKIGVDLAGIVPFDQDLQRINLTGDSIFDLDDTNGAYIAAREIMKIAEL